MWGAGMSDWTNVPLASLFNIGAGISHGIGAAGEKLASILTVDYLREEAAKGRREDFDRFLRAVPDVPDEADPA